MPAIVAWAAADARASHQRRIAIRAGWRCDIPVICEDLTPSILGWAGAGNLTNDLEGLDGCDLTPLLNGAPASDPDRAFLFHYPHTWGPTGHGYQPHSAIRIGKWKAIYFYDPREWELYNIKQDIGETRNLAEKHPVILRRLAARMRILHAKLGAQYPTLKSTGEPEPPLWPGAIRPK